MLEHFGISRNRNTHDGFDTGGSSLEFREERESFIAAMFFGCISWALTSALIEFLSKMRKVQAMASTGGGADVL